MIPSSVMLSRKAKANRGTTGASSEKELPYQSHTAALLATETVHSVPNALQKAVSTASSSSGATAGNSGNSDKLRQLLNLSEDDTAADNTNITANEHDIARQLQETVFGARNEVQRREQETAAAARQLELQRQQQEYAAYQQQQYSQWYALQASMRAQQATLAQQHSMQVCTLYETVLMACASMRKCIASATHRSTLLTYILLTTTVTIPTFLTKIATYRANMNTQGVPEPQQYRQITALQQQQAMQMGQLMEEQQRQMHYYQSNPQQYNAETGSVKITTNSEPQPGSSSSSNSLDIPVEDKQTLDQKANALKNLLGAGPKALPINKDNGNDDNGDQSDQGKKGTNKNCQNKSKNNKKIKKVIIDEERPPSKGTKQLLQRGKAPVIISEDAVQALNWQQQQQSAPTTGDSKNSKNKSSSAHKSMTNHERQQEVLLAQYEAKQKGRESNYAGSAFMNAPDAADMPLPDF